MSSALQAGQAKDMRNRRIIAATHRSFLGRGLHIDTDYLLESGTDAERAVYAHRVLRRLWLFALGAGLLLLGLSFAKPERQAPIVAAYSDAGFVESVQFHDTTFSHTTTVITSAGTFQVSGAVSAAPGDVAKLKDQGAMNYKSLCVESKLETSCYRVL